MIVGYNDSKFAGNTASDCGRHGFRFEGPVYGLMTTDNKLEGNAAYDNGAYGFFVDPLALAPALGNEFEGNECSGNAAGGSNELGICN